MTSPTNAGAIESLLAVPGALPPGTTAAFLEESVDRPAVIAILVVASLVVIISLLRAYARFILSKKYGLDDWLAFASLMPFVAFVTLCIILIHLGSGRHFLYIQYFLDNDQLNETEVLDFAAHIIYTTALLVGRLSGLAFYARISDRASRMKWPIRGAAAFIIAAYLPQLFLIVFHCLPVTGYWPYSFQAEASNYTCLQWGTVYVTNSAISLICDLILFTIPAIIISRLHFSPIRKFKLSLVLMPGLIVIAVSVARMYLVIVGQWTADESWSYDALLAVEVSEIATTIIALSIPALKPFFGSVFSFLDRSTTSGSRGRSSQKGGNGSWQRADDQEVELKAASSGYDGNTAVSSKANNGRYLEKEQGSWVNDSQYAAFAFSTPEERDPSIQSDVSRQAMIQRHVEYEVSRS